MDIATYKRARTLSAVAAPLAVLAPAAAWLGGRSLALGITALMAAAEGKSIAGALSSWDGYFLLKIAP